MSSAPQRSKSTHHRFVQTADATSRSFSGSSRSSAAHQFRELSPSRVEGSQVPSSPGGGPSGHVHYVVKTCRVSRIDQAANSRAAVPVQRLQEKSVFGTLENGGDAKDLLTTAFSFWKAELDRRPYTKNTLHISEYPQLACRHVAPDPTELGCGAK